MNARIVLSVLIATLVGGVSTLRSVTGPPAVACWPIRRSCERAVA